MDTSHTHRQSFFEYLSSENLFEFLPYDQQIHQKYLHSLPIISESLTCINSISSKIMTGIFSLYGPFLMYYENKDAKMPTQVLDLTNSRLLLGAKFVVVRSRNAFELQFTEKKSQIKWIHALKSICIMLNFHERYSLIKSIGRGNFAKVFLLEALSDGKFYAAKVFSKDVSETSEDSSRNKALILNEIALLRQLNHESIPELHEIQETNTSIYLIMDHVQGKNLQELLKSGFSERYSNEEIIFIFHSILKVIAYLHSQGIMHRDLKPANILIEKEGSVRVIDFGFATKIHQKDHILKICGSPGYMAPEIFKYSPQLPGTDYDERCDMFSAGSILFEMLFGGQAFNGCNDSRAMMLNKNSEALNAIFMTIKNELTNQNSKINKDGLRLLLELMVADPTKRLSALEALRHDYFHGINQEQVKFASFLSYYGFENVNNPHNDNWSDFDSHYASVVHQQHHQFYYYSRSELSSRGPKALLHRMSGESILKHYDSVTSKIGHGSTLQKCGTQEISPSPYGSFSDKNYSESLLGLQSLNKRKMSENQRNNGTWRDLKQKGVGLTLQNRIEEVNDESARDNKSKPSTNTLLSSQSLFKKKTKGFEAMKTYQEGEVLDEEEDDDVELGDLGDENCCVGNFIEDLKYQIVKIK